MEERLRSIFQTVSDWLRFAEAKHGAVLAANVAMLAIVSQSQDAVSIPWLSIVGRAFLALSALLSTAAFLPILRPGAPSSKAEGRPTSLLYFAEVARLHPDRYLEMLSEATGETRRPSEIERDYAGQIVTISQIGLLKFRLFPWAAGFFFLGLVGSLFAY